MDRFVSCWLPRETEAAAVPAENMKPVVYIQIRLAFSSCLPLAAVREHK